jgi:hypothetical protein
MDGGELIPFFAIGSAMATGVAITWIRAKHGYPLGGRRGDMIRAIDPDGDRKYHLLSSENERLTGQVGRLEDRIAVLERIVTDPAQRVANQIDALR